MSRPDGTLGLSGQNEVSLAKRTTDVLGRAAEQELSLPRSGKLFRPSTGTVVTFSVAGDPTAAVMVKQEEHIGDANAPPVPTMTPGSAGGDASLKIKSYRHETVAHVNPTKSDLVASAARGGGGKGELTKRQKARAAKGAGPGDVSQVIADYIAVKVEAAKKRDAGDAVAVDRGAAAEEALERQVPLLAIEDVRGRYSVLGLRYVLQETRAKASACSWNGGTGEAAFVRIEFCTCCMFVRLCALS